jgi:hypothetical protein
MKAYTELELIGMIEVATSKEELANVTNHVFQNKEIYPGMWIKIQTMCMKKLVTI